MDTILRSTMAVAADPATAFDEFTEELAAGLEQRGLAFRAGPEGRITAGPDEVAHIEAWQPGERMALAWTVADPDGIATGLELRFRAVAAGTEVTFEVRNWAAGMGPHADVPGWFVSEVAAPLVRALSPARVGDWITDRVARRPSGRSSRANYRDPLYHYPSFRVILAELAPGADDVLLDVGCGGGALLQETLKTGCRAAGVDHSLEMVRVTRESNRSALADGRLQVIQARAERLPFAEDTFTCAAMSGVLGFLPDPVASFTEIRKALRPQGRFVTLGSDSRLRGTPAAPEPIASRLHFYEDDDLERMGRAAGFGHVDVIRRELKGIAREAGIPEEHLSLYAGLTSFLVATKS
ncbi:MAG: methyltransferase domain-containing protein [Gemmatimonadota bacterium]